MNNCFPVEVLSFGEPLVGLYAPPGKSYAEDVSLSVVWGGDTSNVAMAVCRLGHASAYLSKVGADMFGDRFLELWKEAGVDTSHVFVDREHQTGVYFVSFDEGSHRFTYYRKNSAASHIQVEDVDWDFVRSFKVLHLSSISQGISKSALEVSFALMEFARSEKIIISYDVNYRPALWKPELARAVIRHSIEEYADIAVMSAEEMTLLGWGETAGELKQTLHRLPGLWAVKHGSRGCTVVREGEQISIAPIRVEVQDTVGAGDAFAAGVICAVIEDHPLALVGKFANTVAGLTCRERGPLKGQPSREEVERYLAK
jgi:2-dehydro-3-deoxygluconokinase